MFDVNDDLGTDGRAKIGPGTQRCQGHRPRFLPRLFGAEAYTREINHNIANIHLQHGLKRHPSTQTRQAQVCSLFLIQLSNLNV